MLPQLHWGKDLLSERQGILFRFQRNKDRFEFADTRHWNLCLTFPKESFPHRLKRKRGWIKLRRQGGKLFFFAGRNERPAFQGENQCQLFNGSNVLCLNPYCIRKGWQGTLTEITINPLPQRRKRMRVIPIKAHGGCLSCVIGPDPLNAIQISFANSITM